MSDLGKSAYEEANPCGTPWWELSEVQQRAWDFERTPGDAGLLQGPYPYIRYPEGVTREQMRDLLLRGGVSDRPANDPEPRRRTRKRRVVVRRSWWSRLGDWLGCVW